MLKFRSGDPSGTWSRPRGSTTSAHTCLWGLRWLPLIRRVSVGTSSGPTTRRSCFALSLRKTPAFLRSGLDSSSPPSAPSWIREQVKRRDLLSPFQSQVLLGSPKVAGKADSLGQEQAFWTNLWFQPSDTHQVRQFPSTVHPEDQRYSSLACANLDTLTEQFAALGISRHFGCPLSWPTIVTRPTREVQVTNGFLRNWVYMQQSVCPAQLVQQDQLCTRVNEWPRGFWVTWKLRCTITQVSACLERRTCRKITQTSQSCTRVKRLGLWSQMSRAWSLTLPLTEEESSFRDSVLCFPYLKMEIMIPPPLTEGCEDQTS